MESLDEIKQKIELFLKEMEMTATDFGERFMQDRGFVGKLRGGRSPSYETVAKLDGLMINYKLEQAAK